MTRARDLANLAGAADAGTVAGQSLIINGDMAVSQRGTSEASVTSSQYANAPDRFKVEMSSAGTWTVSQSTTAPDGFSYSYKFDCTTADASLSAGDYLQLSHYIEGQNLQHLQKGSSSAKKLTLSFYVRSAKTGTYIVEFYDADNSRSISKSYTIDSADTWEKKTITIDGDTSGAFGNDNGASLGVFFYLGAGSNFTSGTLNTSWGSRTLANVAVGQVNLADSTDNEWYITGVKLEVGSTATPFQHESFGENLAKCQRYFFRVPIENNFEAHPMWNYFTNVASTRIPLGVVMRTAPSVLFEGSTNSATDWDVYYSGAFRSISNINAANITSDSFRINVSASGLTSGGASGLYSRSADAGITASAEL